MQFIKSLDMFGAPVPNLNLRGRAEVKTYCGAYISMMIFILTLLFGILKLQHLAAHKNPQIMTNKIPLEEDEPFNIGVDDFMMAFAVKNNDG